MNTGSINILQEYTPQKVILSSGRIAFIYKMVGLVHVNLLSYHLVMTMMNPTKIF